MNHFWLAMRGFNTRYRRYYFLHPFLQFCFTTFSPTDLHTIPHAYYYRCKCPFKTETLLHLYYMLLCPFYTFSIHLLGIAPANYSCSARKESYFVLFHIIPPRYSNFSIYSDSRIRLLHVLMAICKLCIT